MSWKLWITLLGIAPVFIMVGFMSWQKKKMDADRRREAITTDLRNSPAQSLQKEREDLWDTQLNRMVAALLIGLTAEILIFSRRVSSLADWNWLDTLSVLTIISCGIYYGQQVIRDMPKSRRLKQAIRAEQATAQEIAAALAGDNRIIHDVQAGEFNIDHVVVTPAGVFAVETKSRLKAPVGQGAEAVRVRYDGKQLQFPGWTETEPLEQAARQAKWLANYLSKSTGESYPVTPVLALPGWFVERTARGGNGVVVVNPKGTRRIFLPEQEARLDGKAIQVAAFQIEKLAQLKCET